ncbi:MAG: acyltransferase, partial [Rikenellaceae bacterium]
MDINNIFEYSSFEAQALDIFKYQASNNEVYSRYISLLGLDVNKICRFEEIPYLPIELFKSQKVYCGTEPHELLFRSSGTTSATQSSHYVKKASIYKEAFSRGWETFYGKASECNIYALLPSYLERDGSSLIYMFEKLIEESYDGGFFLYNHDDLIERLNKRDKSKKTILIGVTFALLELAKREDLPKDETLIVMETGGMKGHGEEVPREKLHKILSEAFGVQS